MATPAPPTAPAADDRPEGAAERSDATAHQLTDVVTRLRRALRTSIRTEYPWEALPMAQIELMQALSDQSPARVGDLAARQRLSASTVSGLIGQLMTAGLVVRGTHPDAVLHTDGAQHYKMVPMAHESVDLDKAYVRVTDEGSLVMPALWVGNMHLKLRSAGNV